MYNAKCNTFTDELLLVETYIPPIKELPTPDTLRGPTAAQINNATQNIPEKNTVRKHPQVECSADVSEFSIVLRWIKTK